MGHSVLKCDLCESLVMEGRNEWNCECGAVCNQGTGWNWVKPTHQIQPGSLVQTKSFSNYGQCVLIGVKQDYAMIRYPAIRCSDSKEIWVLNTVMLSELSDIQPPTAESLQVLSLKGPYGDST